MKNIIITLWTTLSLIACADVCKHAKLYEAITTQTPALLCIDQADHRIRLLSPQASGDRKSTLWSYPAEDGKPFKYQPTDAKRVEKDGVIHILIAYHGRVQLVRFKDQKIIKDFPSYSSCHSAELLPGGAIVSANSNHGMLRLHRSADDFVDLALPYAHGVAWDKTRNCLWAVGDFLYQLSFTDDKLTIERKFELPESPTGHDLFPLRDQAKLLVSNNAALFLFDIAAETFETVSKIKGIKSASQHCDDTIWVMHPTTIKDGKSWQSDTVLRVRPEEPKLSYCYEGAKFYKVRWWQDVGFSY